MFKKGLAVIAVLFLISSTLKANNEVVDTIVTNKPIEEEAIFYGCARDCVDIAMAGAQGNMQTYLWIYHNCYYQRCANQ